MQVHHDEELAIRIGPEPCVGVRKDVDEASVGEGIGQQLSRRKLYPGRRRCFECGRQHDQARHRERLAARCGRRTWHVQKLLEREPGDPTSGQRQRIAVARIGKARSRSR